MPRPQGFCRGSYNRFRIEEDLSLCEEVVANSPFTAANRSAAWAQIVHNLNSIPIFKKATDERACKQRLEDLIIRFRNDDGVRLKRYGTDEQLEMLKELLTQIVSIKTELPEFDAPMEEPPKRVLAKPVVKKPPPPIKIRLDPEAQSLLATAFPRSIIGARPVHVPTAPQSSKPVIPTSPATSTPRVAPRLMTAALTTTESDYIAMFAQQTNKQMELREKELQQARDIREKELELDRARLQFEDKKWQHHLQHLDKQQEIIQQMLQQQQDHQQLLFSFLKQHEDKK